MDDATIAVPEPKADAPLCSLNFGFTSGRRFARAILPLAEVELVKDLADVTTNDVVLCVVAGALRDYLQRRHDLPDRPLVANVPVGIKASGDRSRTMGNHITCFTTSLATNVADPWARLETITAVTRESKRRLVRMGRKVVSEWLDLVPPAIFSAAVRRKNRRRRDHPDYLDANVTITSIRGPVWPYYFGSAVVEEMYPTAPPNSGVGVTFAVWDYADDLLVGILSFAGTVEDPGELARGLSRSLSELVAIARCRQGGSASLAGAAVAHAVSGDHW
jgi:WS/DGAT/MGAT family acyltransferase